MRKIAVILSLFTMIFFLAMTTDNVFAFEELPEMRVCVPNEEVALKIADIICGAVFPNINFSNYESFVFYLSIGDSWAITYAPINYTEFYKETNEEIRTLYFLVNPGVLIVIQRENAEVTFINSAYLL